MIEANKICKILQGIDIDSTFDVNGWWETSYGVSFGKERLKEILDYIELEKNDIGIKDIDGKKIYADCSIVEFVNYVDRQVYKGYFKYDLFYQRMFVWFFEPIKNNKPFGYDGIGLERVEYLPGIITNLKIIDTILENKLGLIK